MSNCHFPRIHIATKDIKRDNSHMNSLYVPISVRMDARFDAQGLSSMF